MVPFLIILGVLVLLGLVAIGAYNGLIRGRNQVENAWSQIDVQLKRRIDLIPNLVETVKAYAAHEKSTLEAVINARNAAISAPATPTGQAAADGQMTGALRQLFALGEAYPDLKANQNFSALQAELGATEDRIASARRYYNANVRELNTKVESIPTNFVAGIASVTKAEYFELDAPAEREAPKVSFDPAGPAPAPLPPAQPAPAPIQDAAAYPPAPPTAGSPWGEPPTPPAPPAPPAPQA